MLTSMQIPAFADASGSLLDAKEIRDVLSVLQLIDNARQDIPLAAVLRSGILADRLSVDELLDIRCHDRELPFHDAVRAVAREGRDKGLRERLRALFDRLDYYRKAMGRRPLSDVLWELYTKQGYLAYAGGLPNGAQRRANLLTLHDLARRFGTFRRQGLHRFLVFIRQLDAEKQELPTAPAAGEADNVVRIMSIHQAKGLEFPVVFVAGLGTRFNLQDRSGRMIFERKSGIGLRRVDIERMIEYPTVVHSRVAAEIEASTREEEMRVLYVAMTRARDKLVLVGTRSGVDELQLRGAETTRDPSPPSRLTATTAATPLDWLIPAIDDGTRRESGSLIEPTVHTVDEMTGWRVAKPNEDSDRETRRAVARLEELPHDEPVATDLPEVESVRSRVEFVYPFLASSSVRAVLAASEFKGIYGLQRDPDQQRREPSSDDFSVPESRYTPAGGDRAAQRGSITHRTLQHLNFTVAVDASGLASELHRLVAAGVLSQEECESVDSDSLAWFLSTPLCTVIRNAGKAYRREFMYLSTESLTYVDGSIDAPPEDAVLIRGVVDGVIVHPDEVELLDFKTDTIGPDEVAERCERYRPQLALYARAMAGMWRRPVKACWLVFLGARKIVSLGDLTASTTQSGK